jgi:Zn-dependent protease with chaperone function
MLLLRRLLSVPLVILAVPALGLGAVQLLTGASYRVRLLGLIPIDARKGAELLSALSIASVIVGIVLLATIYSAAALCGESRGRLAGIFAPLVTCVSLGVAGLGLLHMSVFVCAVTLLLLGLMHIIPVGLLIAVVVGAFYTTEELARCALRLTTPVVTTVLGIEATRDGERTLWRKLDEIATIIGARAPDHVVLGLQPEFFATGGRLILPNKKTLEGETLHVPLTLVRLLSQEEFAAVAGHELSHFIGEDTAFTLRFLPIYQRLSDALGAAHTVGGYGSLTAMPSRIVLREAFLSFAHAERRISRRRELAADRAGAATGNPEALITAILRAEAAAALWPGAVQATITAMNAGMSPCVCNWLKDSAAALIGSDQGLEAISKRLQAERTNPSDTHPTLAARAHALGVDSASLLPLPPVGDLAASALIENITEQEAVLDSLLRHALVASGAVRAPRDPSRPNYLEKKRLQRVKQAEARRARIDASNLTEEDRTMV